MKRLTVLIISIFILLTFNAGAKETEMRGVWFSYQDYKSNLHALNEADYKLKADEICKNIAEGGFNTIIFHARAFSDAFYSSKLFPYSRFVCGEAGVSPGYDPLKIMCEVAHTRGLKIHAWINPYRIGTPQNVTTDSVPVIWKEQYGDERVCEYNGSLYYNPASSEARAYIIEGVKEIVSNYDIDGIHFDDYFYPTADESFDKSSYMASGSTQSINEWRLENVNVLIKDTYKVIKEINPDVLFGISPNADIEKNYSTLFADVKRWCTEEGYADYVTPQIYFGFENSVLPFKETADKWLALCTYPDLYIGLAPYKSGFEDKWAGEGKAEWTENSDILSRQIDYLRGRNHFGGVMMFSYSSFWGENVTENAKAELEGVKRIFDRKATGRMSFMDMIKSILKYMFIFN